MTEPDTQPAAAGAQAPFAFDEGYVKEVTVAEGYGHLDIVLQRFRFGAIDGSEMTFKFAAWKGSIQIIVSHFALAGRAESTRERRPLTLWLSGPQPQVARTSRLAKKLPPVLRHALKSGARSIPKLVEQLHWRDDLVLPVTRSEWRRLAQLAGDLAYALPD